MKKEMDEFFTKSKKGLRRGILQSKTGQVTIFVIIALILVVVIALIFVLIPKEGINIKPSENPKGYIDNCVSNAVEEAIEKILPTGGYLNVENGLNYNNQEVAYLCYIEEERKICINQEPMLIDKMESEIYNYIKPQITNCFNSLKSELEGYQEIDSDFIVDIRPNAVIVLINKKITYIQRDSTNEINGFDSSVESSLFDIARITNQIINEEVNCDCGNEICNADVVKLSGQNQDFELEKFVTGKNEEVYTIKNRKLKEEFVFAIRNCIRLP